MVVSGGGGSLNVASDGRGSIRRDNPAPVNNPTRHALERRLAAMRRDPVTN